MPVLVMGPDQREALKKVREYAEANPVTSERFQRIMHGEEPTVCEDPRFQAELPVGYRVAFSIEDQPKAGKVRHLSMSVDRRGKLPSLEVVLMVMEELGFRAKSFKEVSRAWVENNIAINVLEAVCITTIH